MQPLEQIDYKKIMEQIDYKIFFCDHTHNSSHPKFVAMNHNSVCAVLKFQICTSASFFRRHIYPYVRELDKCRQNRHTVAFVLLMPQTERYLLTCLSEVMMVSVAYDMCASDSCTSDCHVKMIVDCMRSRKGSGSFDRRLRRKIHFMFDSASAKGLIDMFTFLGEYYLEPNPGSRFVAMGAFSEAFQTACKHGHQNILKQIVSWVYDKNLRLSSQSTDYGLRQATKNGHAHVVDWCLNNAYVDGLRVEDVHDTVMYICSRLSNKKRLSAKLHAVARVYVKHGYAVKGITNKLFT